MAASYTKGAYFVNVEEVIAAIRDGEPIYWGDKLRTHKSMLDTTLRMLIVATAMRQLTIAVKEDYDMASINKAILIGRLGKDPERKTTRDGKEFSAFSIATSKKIKEEEKTQWHNVIVWNEHSAKYVNDYAIKGTMIYVEGEIEYRTWEKQDGGKGYTTDIVVGQYNGNVQILNDGRPKQGRGQAEPDYEAASKGGKRAPAAKTRPEPHFEEDPDDEIPF